MLLPIIALSIIIVLLKSVGANSENPVVCSESGCVRGKLMPGYQSKKMFEAFLGIPFAKSPVGELRFQDPKPIERWSNILDAQTEKNICIQKNYLIPNPTVMGDEDCLYLYIYRPQAKSNALFPVMVYIHGGGYFAGSGGPSIIGPEYFMDTGKVVLVSIQYRLSVLGFLSTGDNSSSGNFALKDQSLALQWIQSNIEYYGGNPNLVTIFGQSAGAASVHMHMMSPLSRDLFDQAIVISGNAIAPYNQVNRNPLDLARKHAHEVGIVGSESLSTKDLVDELRKINASLLIDVTERLKYWSVDPLTLYGPVVEHYTVQNGFLYAEPHQMWKDGNFKQMPWMTGTVTNDGAVRSLAITSNDTLLADFNKNMDIILPKLLELKGDSVMVRDKLRRIKKRYFDGRNYLSKNDSQRFTDLVSDLAFIHPLYKSVKQYVATADINKNPVFLYKFAFKGLLSFSVLYTGNYNDYGVVHCDELIYLFRSPAIFPREFDVNSVEAKMIKILTNYFADFATNGSPPFNDNIKLCKDSTIPKCDYHRFTKSNKSDDSIDITIDNTVDQQMLLFWNSLET